MNVNPKDTQVDNTTESESNSYPPNEEIKTTVYELDIGRGVESYSKAPRRHIRPLTYS